VHHLANNPNDPWFVVNWVCLHVELVNVGCRGLESLKRLDR
jgi:hypothetical protein